MLKILQYQVRYAAWANQRMLAAVDNLSTEALERDFGTADKSISGTLAHIYRAERIWLARIQNQTADFEVPGDGALAALRANWPPLNASWIQWISNLTSEAADSDLTFQDRKGNNWRQPLWQIVLHVVNHSTHHRGQVAGFVRALGQRRPLLILFSSGALFEKCLNSEIAAKRHRTRTVTFPRVTI